MKLKGKTAVVTGASSGMERQIAVFLASDDVSFLNGQCIAVDGGWTSYM